MYHSPIVTDSDIHWSFGLAHLYRKYEPVNPLLTCPWSGGGMNSLFDSTTPDPLIRTFVPEIRKTQTSGEVVK